MHKYGFNANEQLCIVSGRLRDKFDTLHAQGCVITKHLKFKHVQIVSID